MMLHLYEEMLLLALHEEKGVVVASAQGNLGVGLAGAMLADLVLLGKLRLEDPPKVQLVDPASTGDELLDEVIEKLQGSDRQRKLSYWVNELSDKPKKMIERLQEHLEEKGVLRQEEGRFYPVIPFVECPGQKASAKFWIKSQLRTLALTDGEADLHGLALLTLVQACDQLDLIFTKDERKGANRRVYALMVGESLRNPMAQSIDEISRAVESLVESD